MNSRAAEAVENEDGEEGRARGEERTSQALVRRFVDDLFRQRFGLTANFAHTVEENDRVVQGVTDERKERRNGGKTNLKLDDSKEGEEGGKPVAQRDQTQGEANVVDQTDDRGETEDRATESEPEVSDDADEASQDRENTLNARVTRDGRTDGVGSFENGLFGDGRLSLLSDFRDGGDVGGVENHVPVSRRGVRTRLIRFIGNVEGQNGIFAEDVGEVTVDDFATKSRIRFDGDGDLGFRSRGAGRNDLGDFADRVLHGVTTKLIREFFLEHLFDLQTELVGLDVGRARSADRIARFGLDFVTVAILRQREFADGEVGKFAEVGTDLGNLNGFGEDGLDFHAADEIDVEDSVTEKIRTATRPMTIIAIEIL